MTHFIDGAWIEGAGEEFRSVNPADGAVIWTGRAATADQVDAAVAAAARMADSWAMTPFEERVATARRYAEILVERKAELAELVAKDAGKTLWDATGEATAMANKIEISLKAYDERTGFKEAVNGSIRSKLAHRPHGVMAVFGPYNFPGHLPNGHIVPALIAGNTIVFKPSELTPAVAELMVKCWDEAGLPKGVLNLVQGARDTGAALIANKHIDGLLFTGSARTGQIIARELVDRPNVIQALELGGNNPLIVHEVQDHAAAAVMTVQSAFISSGQRCTCARRLFLENNATGDAILERLVAVTKQIKSGSYDDEDAFISSLISEKAALGLVAAQQELIDLGGKVLVEMKHTPGTGFVTPSIVEVTNVKNIPDEEHFGPL